MKISYFYKVFSKWYFYNEIFKFITEANDPPIRNTNFAIIYTVCIKLMPLPLA